jgi:hypothetical protein
MHRGARRAAPRTRMLPCVPFARPQNLEKPRTARLAVERRQIRPPAGEAQPAGHGMRIRRIHRGDAQPRANTRPGREKRSRHEHLVAVSYQQLSSLRALAPQARGRQRSCAWDLLRSNGLLQSQMPVAARIERKPRYGRAVLATAHAEGAVCAPAAPPRRLPRQAHSFPASADEHRRPHRLATASPTSGRGCTLLREARARA